MVLGIEFGALVLHLSTRRQMPCILTEQRVKDSLFGPKRQLLHSSNCCTQAFPMYILLGKSQQANCQEKKNPDLTSQQNLPRKAWPIAVKSMCFTTDHTYPNLDTGASGSTQPVAVGAETQGIDDVPTIQCVKVFAFIQIPQHGLAILNREKR